MSDTEVDTEVDAAPDTDAAVEPGSDMSAEVGGTSTETAAGDGGGDAASGSADDSGVDAAATASSDGGTTGDARELLVREGDIAADYLERLLDIADYDGDIDLDVENDRAIVAIVGGDLHALVGQHGETLDALQELTRLAVQQQTGTRSRLMLDISGHRQARRAELQALAADTATRVLEGGEPVRLRPMNPFERKVVHDAISEVDGVLSESEGEEPHRRVVVLTAR